jgi:hypothetical protein
MACPRKRVIITSLGSKHRSNIMRMTIYYSLKTVKKTAHEKSGCLSILKHEVEL